MHRQIIITIVSLMPLQVIATEHPTAVELHNKDVGNPRVTWGIESLRWPILTDTNHVVIAEGFSLNQLDFEREEMR